MSREEGTTSTAGAGQAEIVIPEGIGQQNSVTSSVPTSSRTRTGQVRTPRRAFHSEPGVPDWQRLFPRTTNPCAESVQTSFERYCRWCGRPRTLSVPQNSFTGVLAGGGMKRVPERIFAWASHSVFLPSADLLAFRCCQSGFWSARAVVLPKGRRGRPIRYNNSSPPDGGLAHGREKDPDAGR
jgi:hypothetical protein